MKQLIRWACVGSLIGGALFGLLLLITFALNAHAQGPEKPAEPAEPDAAEIILVPAALWIKMRDAVLYWHDEAQRYKAMKGCA